ncbi:MAG: YceK/YidQ family lipoprotein [Planctomycetes bacterium]|nr:YceK/YidQ family lipoprotein [Planctomycetota bacterium]
MRQTALCISLLLSASMSSCAAVAGRAVVAPMTRSEWFFQGIRCDYLVITDQADLGITYEPSHSSWGWRLFAAVDILPSALLDVALLPADTIVWCIGAAR